MKWSDEYATGVERLDDQHKMIFKMAEDFRGALDEGLGERVYGSLLQALDLYVSTHFHFEEKCMNRYRCPVAQKNKEAHGRFAEVLSGFQQRYAVSGFDREEARAFVDTIDQWLSAHICGIDVHLKRCVQDEHVNEGSPRS
jgi:hemerythrin